MYIFLDESGNFKGDKENYFVVGGFVTNDPKRTAKAVIQVETLDSATSPNIQIADWICGSLFHHYNKSKNGRNYFSILKNNIVNSKELFESYWFELYKNENKKTPHKKR